MSRTVDNVLLALASILLLCGTLIAVRVTFFILSSDSSCAAP